MHTSIFNFINSAYGDQIRTQNGQNWEGRSKKNETEWINKWEVLGQNREGPTQKHKKEWLNK